ncbi:MAG: alanine--tRNA ligase [Clostridia bacterium]
MKKLSSKELRKEYLDFFKQRGHKEIPSASLIPDNDPTVLFTTAGMHPLVPYLLGESHPLGKRLTNCQKCVRTGDIDKVGDSSHCTFFEMLGNWSLGDYFKEESISYSFEFLTKVLEIPVEKLAITCFEGDENAPKDEISYNAWLKKGIKKENIYFLSKEHNWWGPAGNAGPCGPDTEIFIIADKEPCSKECSPACDCGRFLEIWNNVFMEYDQSSDGSLKPLKQKNVDTGMGLERTVAVLNGYDTVYQIDVFKKAKEILDAKEKEGEKQKRIILDHMRTAVFLLGDIKGVTPSNVDQGYVLRRLIRRAVRFARLIELDSEVLLEICQAFIDEYGEVYEDISQNREKILSELGMEILRFNKTIEQGLKEYEKLLKYIKDNRMSGKAAFRLYDTFGFPIEMTLELAKDHGVSVDIEGFERAFEEHQRKSKIGSEQKFKGGLAENTERTARLHTATHLLLCALKKVLNDQNIHQKGSNITAERLRFDFNFPRALTEQEKNMVEDYINGIIKEGVDVTQEEMSLKEAMDAGAEGVFGDRYQDKVKVYSIGDYSKEICGGPHIKNTSELGTFKIIKEQSSSSGIRRIRAILE